MREQSNPSHNAAAHVHTVQNKTTLNVEKLVQQKKPLLRGTNEGCTIKRVFHI